MAIHAVLPCCAVILLASILPTRMQALDLPGGLKFGQDFSEVEAIVRDNRWRLQKSEVISYAWNVEDEGLTLYFCGEIFTSIDQSTTGTISSFVDTVWDFRMQFGEPDTDVVILSPRSQFEQHTVQSVFEIGNGLRIGVQIYARGDRQALLTRISDSSVCGTQ